MFIGDVYQSVHFESNVLKREINQRDVYQRDLYESVH